MGAKNRRRIGKVERTRRWGGGKHGMGIARCRGQSWSETSNNNLKIVKKGRLQVDFVPSPLGRHIGDEEKGIRLTRKKRWLLSSY